jgi:RNA polymerase sigma factor (sigma-70 family)
MNPLFNPIGSDHVGEAYQNLYPLLLNPAIRRFRVPEAEAENLIHELFCRLLENHRNVRSLRDWLVGGVSNGCRAYWRSQGARTFEVPDFDTWVDSRSESFEESVRHSMLVAQVRGRLSDRDVAILTWRHVEGWTTAEIAGRLRISPAYAAVLVHRCLRRARVAYVELCSDDRADGEGRDPERADGPRRVGHSSSAGSLGSPSRSTGAFTSRSRDSVADRLPGDAPSRPDGSRPLRRRPSRAPSHSSAPNPIRDE